MNNLKKTLLLLLLPTLPAGCHFYRAPLPSPGSYYYLNQNKDLFAVGRVAVVELDNESSYPAISADVTKALFQAFQKKQIFGLTLIPQSDPAWRSLLFELDPAQPTKNRAFKLPPTYTLEQLLAIRKALKSDAVMLGTVTEYQPYPHMAIGLRLKLIDLNDGQLLWALEQIWNSADRTTEYRIKKYFRRQLHSGFAPLKENLVVVSPVEFIRFVAYETAETIRPNY